MCGYVSFLVAPPLEISLQHFLKTSTVSNRVKSSRHHHFCSLDFKDLCLRLRYLQKAQYTTSL